MSYGFNRRKRISKFRFGRIDRRALLQIVGGLLLITVVFVFSLYQTKGAGIEAYAGGPIVMGENIRGEDDPTLNLTAATYGVIGVDISEEEYVEAVILAASDDADIEEIINSNPYLAAYYAQDDGLRRVYGGIGDEAEPGSEAPAEEISDTEEAADTEEMTGADEEESGSEEETEASDEETSENGTDGEEAAAADTDAAADSTSEADSEPETETDAADSSVNETRESEDPADAVDEPVYVAYSADQIKNIIRTRRYGGNIDSMVAELGNCPDDRARVWEEIFDYWDQVNQPGFTNKYNVNSGADPSLPGDLPNDHSLCFVVLGCGLNANGTIRPEMEYRCMTALRCAQMYPNSYVLCTGGHTAGGNYAASEGGVMGNWLIEHGVDSSRVIIEDASYQTCENAMKSVPLLKNNYPQVNTLVLVTSDYHVPLGALTLQAECLLDGNARVVANVGCAAPRYVNFGNGELGKQLEKLAFQGRR